MISDEEAKRMIAQVEQNDAREKERWENRSPEEKQKQEKKWQDSRERMRKNADAFREHIATNDNIVFSRQESGEMLLLLIRASTQLQKENIDEHGSALCNEIRRYIKAKDLKTEIFKQNRSVNILTDWIAREKEATHDR